jgi:hypothetical protein
MPITPFLAGRTFEPELIKIMPGLFRVGRDRWQHENH